MCVVERETAGATARKAEEELFCIMLWSEDLEAIIKVWCKANDNMLGSSTQTDGRTRGGLSVDIQVQLFIDKEPTSGVLRALHACNATDATKSKDCIFLRL